MIFRWAGYLLLVVFAAYEAIVFTNIIVSMLFVAALLWPFIMLSCLFMARRSLEIEMKVPVPVAEKKGRIQIQLIVSKKGWLPVSQISANMVCTSFFSGNKENYPLYFRVDGRGQQQYIYELTRNSCGRLRLEIDRLRLWDYFHFFSMCKKVHMSEEVIFLPQMYETAVTVSEATRHFAGETEDYEPEAAGLDHSQIYQIREYRPGDRLQMIHWKLTARSDELFVKEASEPVCFAVAIFMDLSAGRKTPPASVEAMLETVLSISYGLMEQKCRHFIVWYDAGNDRLIKRRIGSIEDIYEATEYLMTIKLYKHGVELQAMYKERYPYGLYAVGLMVDLSGQIHRDNEVIGSWRTEDLERSLSELLIQV